MSGHRCSAEECPVCESAAERRAEDTDPDYDLDAAADQYERALGW